ncbi:hypothetical protein [Hymenobacter metallilatus]|uniref:Uncharacterized protein n=1 Tax=Hymenobacter metallilatus TaxID=2493666 RepID=A0A428JLU6_9BACT|nr:hypothetical protein [Hymenobacter metallilatus]RSK33948.1 hypothetical protein EI290_09590 [Hymenobacter metallilatus]
MRSITITDPATNQVYPGHIPTGWHEVPVSAFQQFARLQLERRPELAMLSAVQALTSLPADVLAADVSLAAYLGQQMPWFFTGLPEAEPAATLVHRGIEYTWQGDFSRLNAGQFEALLAFLDAAGGSAAVAAPELLAVLLVRTGGRQDAQAVREATEALAGLSMEQAWPYVLNFLKAWMMPALRIQASSLATTRMETALEQMLALTSVQPAKAGLRQRCSGIAAGLARRYVRSVVGRLRSS